ncbi:MAG: alpha/beta fold hydrolase [Anaerolineales bacterium]
MPTLQSNGITLAYEVTGSGPPLLLIAGVGYSAWFWHRIVPGLAGHFHVITFDNRGTGESDKPTGPYTVPMMAEDTAGLLDALQIKGAYVMGHSLGGFIAQELAITRPDLVSKLILASTNHGGPDAIPITPEAMKVLTDRSGNPLELVKRGLAIAAAPGLAVRQLRLVEKLISYRLTNPVPPAQYTAQVMAGAGMATLTDGQVAERMAAIRVPVLILFGEFDRVVPPGNAERMAGKLSNAKITILPNTGHIFPLEDPEATVKVVVEFISMEGIGV